jgi:hypothetical protein
VLFTQTIISEIEMKQLDTIVEDIYGLFKEDGYKIPRDEAAVFVKAMTTRLNDVILDRIYDEDRERTPSLRMSNIGKKDRQLYYDLNADADTEAEKIAPEVYIKFMYGDIIEEMLLLFAKLSGHVVTDEQKEVEVNGVLGHMDCQIDGVPLDCKSASKFSFSKFFDGSWVSQDPFGYRGQLAGYMEAMEADRGAFLVLNKETGQICLASMHKMELPNATDRIEYLKEVIAKDTPPEQCYEDVADGESGNRVLNRNCGWCRHKFTCWSDSNGGNGLRTFTYSNGPKHFTQVAKTPRVEEVIHD